MDTKPNRIQRMKTWVSNHSEQIVIGAISAGVIALYAAAVVASYKDAAVQAADALERQDKLRDAINRNDVSLVTIADEIWVVPNEQIHKPSA